MALDVVQHASPSGYVQLPSDIVGGGRTGPSPIGTELLSLDGIFSLGQPVMPVATGKFQVSYVGALLGGDSRRSVTSYRSSLVIEDQVPITYCAPGEFFIRMGRVAASIPEGAEPARDVDATAVTPAEELRTLSGLSSVLLARLFGVSRTTYYKWIEGATPRDARFQHLLDVLAHVKEAQRRLSPSNNIAAWLRTSVSAGGLSPLQYLEQKRFSTFRGLLLRAKSAELALESPLPSALAAPPLSRAEYRAGRERISPTPRIEEEAESGEDSVA